MSLERPTELDPIALLRELIAIDSVNPDLVPGAGGEAAIAAWCAEWLAGHGFEVHVLEELPGRPSVVGIARGHGGGPSLMLNGHLDTVGVGTWAGPGDGASDVAGLGTRPGVRDTGTSERAGDGAFSPHPFGGGQRDGLIFGRGAFDMKGGVAAILVAAARASAAGLAGDVVVALVADEEFGSRGTEEVLRNFRADAAIVAEPSELDLVVAHRGFAWFEVHLTGRPAHGSMPAQGVDAIAHAGAVLRALDDLGAQLAAAPPHPLLAAGSVRVSMISGGTDAATVASSCTLTIERRTLPGQSPAAVEHELRTLLEEVAAEVPHFDYRLTCLVARGAFEADPGWPIVTAVAASAEQVLGRAPLMRGEPFWTDAGLILEAGIPCLLIGVDGGGAHADLEWASEASVIQLTSILEGAIGEYCNSAFSSAGG
jgi:acetylornithine deacetylase